MKSNAPKTRSAKTVHAEDPSKPETEPMDTPEPTERPTYEGTLKSFVEHAWQVLEPVAPLQWNWHLDLICEYLTAIKNNDFRKAVGLEKEGVIFNVPPRTMKSLLITVMFPVWVWTTHPARRFMFVSYSEKLSTQHSVYRRNVIESDFYQEHWSSKFSFAKDQNLKSHYENSARGAMFSTAMQATATGMGGDILIFDDPLNPEQALSEVEREAVNLRFDSTFRSRLNNPQTGVKIVVMHRLAERDLTGHLLPAGAHGEARRVGASLQEKEGHLRGWQAALGRPPSCRCPRQLQDRHGELGVSLAVSAGARAHGRRDHTAAVGPLLPRASGAL